MLRSNIAACHLKLEDWKSAVEVASKALDGLDKLQGKEKGDVKVEEAEEEADEEIISEGATKAEDVSAKGKRESDIDRIRAKALMRRARGRSEMGGWSSLQGAEEGWLDSAISCFQQLTTPRLQNPLKNEQPLISGYEDCAAAVITIAFANERGTGERNRGDDG